MKTIPHCLECNKPISWGVHIFSQRLYGYSLCMKDQYLIGESGATAETVDIYLALKSRNFPVILDYFDGYKQVDIALPGKLYIEVNGSSHLADQKFIADLTRAVYSPDIKIPTIILTNSLLNNPRVFGHTINELSKACRVMLKPSFEFSLALAPPLTEAQLQ